jgi:hypothetical protein
MAYEFVNTLFGPEIINTAPKCKIFGCDSPAHNMGYGRYRAMCHIHHNERYGMYGWSYKTERKDYCENVDGRLGFKCTTTIISPKWQLDVDHIDGVHYNDDDDNLQTLCKCCHAYKTMVNEENLPLEKRKKFLEEKYAMELKGNS